MNKLTDRVTQQIQQITFDHTRKVMNGGIGLVFYDMTTLFF